MNVNEGPFTMDLTWLPVLGLEGRYEVSANGDIRNCISGKLLKPQPINRGYLTLKLPNIGASGYRTNTVHSVVAEAFLGARPHGAQVNHKDGDKTNNRLDNLEWATQSENMRHALSLGLRKCGPRGPRGPNKPGGKWRTQAGSANYNARITEADAIEIIRLSKTGATPTVLAEQFGICKSLVSYIKTGKRWPHLPR